MAETNATILIPDISGFTEYMTTTELNHSSYAIHKLINAIVNTVGDEYEISEIEGDAVLMIKKGPPPSQKEILDTCLRIFNAFHLQRNWMQHRAVCPCAACVAISNLTLKFVVHYGPLVEMKVGSFVKHSGTEMIVAHRLMKNSIESNEYVLITEKLLQQVADSSEAAKTEWINASEEYAAIGKVDYRFMLLNEARKNVSEPPMLQNHYSTDDTPYLQLTIANNYKDVYRRIAKIPYRSRWVPGLQKVEQDAPEVYVGSIHYCTFNDYHAIVSPLRMTLAPNEIIYAESCLIEEMNLRLIYEFVFTQKDENTCGLAARFMNGGESPLPESLNTAFYERLKQMVESLKEYCEK
ncbi:MAG: DUF2652 domain-containing protein [Bacteroidota bacterium]|nr:DUF2652 domain-containing protein [Bacteroidota bacterium]